MEHPTTVVATTALMTPFWLPALSGASEVAATITPLLGAIWLIVQIGSKLYSWIKRNEDK